MFFPVGPKRMLLYPVLLILLLISACQLMPTEEVEEKTEPNNEVTVKNLPEPEKEGAVSLEEALGKRVSIRSFEDDSLSLQQLGQMLWAAQGSPIDAETGATRTVPSAGPTHPMEIFLVVGKAEELPAGVYQYDIANHELILHLQGDLRHELSEAALGQDFIALAPVNIVVTAEYARTTGRYGERGERYVEMESGGVAQNIALQAAALELGSVLVGAFEDDEVEQLLGLDYAPLLIIPVGHPGS